MPELPPLESGAYLITHLFDAGPVVYGEMGTGPLTSKDLMAWCEETGIYLQPWEAKFIRRLSSEYLNEQHKAEKQDRPAPWQEPDAKPVVTSTQAALRALAQL